MLSCKGGRKLFWPGQIAPRGEDNQDGGDIPRYLHHGEKLPGGGGDKINCYTGTDPCINQPSHMLLIHVFFLLYVCAFWGRHKN